MVYRKVNFIDCEQDNCIDEKFYVLLKDWGPSLYLDFCDFRRRYLIVHNNKVALGLIAKEDLAVLEAKVLDLFKSANCVRIDLYKSNIKDAVRVSIQNDFEVEKADFKLVEPAEGKSKTMSGKYIDRGYRQTLVGKVGIFFDLLSEVVDHADHIRIVEGVETPYVAKYFAFKFKGRLYLITDSRGYASWIFELVEGEDINSYLGLTTEELMTLVKNGRGYRKICFGEDEWSSFMRNLLTSDRRISVPRNQSYYQCKEFVRADLGAIVRIYNDTNPDRATDVTSLWINQLRGHVFEASNGELVSSSSWFGDYVNLSGKSEGQALNELKVVAGYRELLHCVLDENYFTEDNWSIEGVPSNGIGRISVDVFNLINEVLDLSQFDGDSCLSSMKQLVYSPVKMREAKIKACNGDEITGRRYMNLFNLYLGDNELVKEGDKLREMFNAVFDNDVPLVLDIEYFSNPEYVYNNLKAYADKLGAEDWQSIKLPISITGYAGGNFHKVDLYKAKAGYSWLSFLSLAAKVLYPNLFGETGVTAFKVDKEAQKLVYEKLIEIVLSKKTS